MNTLELIAKQGPPERGPLVKIKTKSMDVNIIVNDEIDWEIVQRCLLRANEQRYSKTSALKETIEEVVK